MNAPGWPGNSPTWASSRKDLVGTALEFGMHAVRLDPAQIGAQHSIEFTRRFLGARGWEQRDWQVRTTAVGNMEEQS